MKIDNLHIQEIFEENVSTLDKVIKIKIKLASLLVFQNGHNFVCNVLIKRIAPTIGCHSTPTFSITVSSNEKQPKNYSILKSSYRMLKREWCK